MQGDPREQLARTILEGLLTKEEHPPPNERREALREVPPSGEAMEALTAALLDPCITVEEAVVQSLLDLNHAKAQRKPQSS